MMTAEIYMRDKLELYTRRDGKDHFKRHLIYPKWYHRILIPFGYHHTWWSWGRENAAKLLGGLTGYVIDRIGIRNNVGGVWDYCELNISYGPGVGEINVDNEDDPFTDSGTFNAIRMTHNTQPGNGHIQETINITLGSDDEMYSHWNLTFTPE